MSNQREENTSAVENSVKDAVNNYKHSGTSSDTYNPKIAGTLRATRSLLDDNFKKINTVHVTSEIEDELRATTATCKKHLREIEKKRKSEAIKRKSEAITWLQIEQKKAKNRYLYAEIGLNSYRNDDTDDDIDDDTDDGIDDDTYDYYQNIPPFAKLEESMTAKENDNAKTVIEEFGHLKFQLQNAIHEKKSAETTLEEKRKAFKAQYRKDHNLEEIPDEDEDGHINYRRQKLVACSSYQDEVRARIKHLFHVQKKLEDVKAEMKAKLQELQSLRDDLYRLLLQKPTSKKRKPSAEKLPPKKAKKEQARYATGTDFEDEPESDEDTLSASGAGYASAESAAGSSVSVDPPRPDVPQDRETRQLLNAEIKDDAKQISLSFSDEYGQEYNAYIPINRKIKYKVFLPRSDEPIYCSTAASVAACLKSNGVDYKMWKVYRHMKRTSTETASGVSVEGGQNGVIGRSGARIIPV